MKVTVLGGAAAIPNAGQGCAGFFIDDGRTRIVLDLGPGTLAELRRLSDLTDLAAVVISHCHLDHVLDVLTLRHGLAFKPEPRPDSLPVLLPPGGVPLLRDVIAPLEHWAPETPFEARVPLSEYDPKRPLPLGSLTLTFHRTVHDVPCWAVRIASAESPAVVIYGADGGPASALAAFGCDADLLIAEATLTEGSAAPDRGSLTAWEAGALASRSGAKRLLLIHIWQEHGLDRQQSAAATAYSGPITVARPGLTIAL